MEGTRGVAGTNIVEGASRMGGATGLDGIGLLESFLAADRYVLSKHQLESYRIFLEKKVPEALRDNNPYVMQKKESAYDIEVRVWMGGKGGTDGLNYSRPLLAIDGSSYEPLLPGTARNTGSVYDLRLAVDILVEIEDRKAKKTEERLFESIEIGRIPLMLHSHLCYLFGKTSAELSELG